METGITETGDPLKPEGFQAKIVPATELLADNEEEAPKQIVAGVAKGVITGLGFTITETIFEPVHPAAVPVTVYVVVEMGVTETGVPFEPPGFQMKVVPATELFADNEEEAP